MSDPLTSAWSGGTPGKPGVVHLKITSLCNCQCQQCDIWRQRREDELDLPAWKAVVDNLFEWLGPFTLKIAGGEPLVKPWLPELILHARRQRCFTGISTNGLLLTPQMADRLLQAGLSEINISLDSLRPELHDELRQWPGAHARVLDAIEHFRRAKATLDINIAAVIMEPNLGELTDLAYWSRENNINCLTFQPVQQNFGQPYNPHWYKESPLFPKTPERTDRVLDELIAFRRRYWLIGNRETQLEAMKVYFRNPELKPNVTCTAGESDAAIDAQGGLSLCFNLPPIGNLTQAAAAEIWRSAEAERGRAMVRSCPRNCTLLNCVYTDDLRREQR